MDKIDLKPSAGQLSTKFTNEKTREDKSISVTKSNSIPLMRRIQIKLKKIFEASKKLGTFAFSMFVFVILPMYIEWENNGLRDFVKTNGITHQKLMQYEKKAQSSFQTRRY